MGESVPVLIGSARCSSLSHCCNRRFHGVRALFEMLAGFHVNLLHTLVVQESVIASDGWSRAIWLGEILSTCNCGMEDRDEESA